MFNLWVSLYDGIVVDQATNVSEYPTFTKQVLVRDKLSLSFFSGIRTRNCRFLQRSSFNQKILVTDTRKFEARAKFSAEFSGPFNPIIYFLSH